MFDAHCHLQLRDFDRDRESVLRRAFSCGVTGLMTLGTEPDDWQSTLNLSCSDRRVFAGIGIHPFSLRNWEPQDDVKKIEALNAAISENRSKLSMLGECGLDARIMGDVPMSRQIRVLESQIELALDHDLPLSLHCVHAHGELQQSLKRLRGSRGILHAFSGSLEQARAYLRLGDFAFSFGGALTFPPSPKRLALIRGLPESLILAETDAPDGPPFNFKAGNSDLQNRVTDLKQTKTFFSMESDSLEGTDIGRIEPYFIAQVVKSIAQLRGSSDSEWIQRTSINMDRILAQKAC